MKLERKKITPDLATTWLEANIDNNRPISQSRVDGYARDMKAGNWTLTHQAIAFDTEGRLIDGQHRLWAVVESGITVEMTVATDCDPESVTHIDQGQSRTVRDILTITGHRPAKDVVSVANRMRIGLMHGRAMTASEMIEFLELNGDAIAFVSDQFPSKTPKGLSQAAIKAVLARASYSVEHERIRRFAYVLATGFMGEKEQIVIKLRDTIRNNADRRPPASEVYGKCSRALQAFLDGEDMRNLYSPSQELFLLPVGKMLKSDRPNAPSKAKKA